MSKPYHYKRKSTFVEFLFGELLPLILVPLAVIYIAARLMGWSP